MVLVATDLMAIGSLQTITPEIARTTTDRTTLQQMAIGVHHNRLLTRIDIRAEHRAIVPTMGTDHPTSETIINMEHLILAGNPDRTTIGGREQREETVIVPPMKSILRAITSGTITPGRLMTATIALMRGHNATSVTIAASLLRPTRSGT
jgi:hypothetical protein